ncbi:TetR/AcrR family transcriptional regulator [Amphibacillus cookii]|uniref:TetR/AcrR family transcriptional regulator n=1 Tax=Amphibacillus cookii TaxID=767787 RepID=UPI00195A4FE0|nr:helix-turn-helix domain-containing protein [Amphibacillus cookii]MBM7539974.1 AcrR family transcriptional regulator [Amphibacillus cookii]
MKKDRKTLQRTRMWQYFIEAATDLITEEGMEKLTIRKVAELAGYTSSTAYNYFTDLSQLKFFAALRFTKSYSADLPTFLAKGNNTIEKWLYSWECFCKHSFKQPYIYAVIFIENVGSSAQSLLDKYYDVFPDDLIAIPQEIKELLMDESFARRSSKFIEPAIEEGFIDDKHIEHLADITFMIWTGAMTTYMNQRRGWTEREAIQYTLEAVQDVIIQYIKPDKRALVQYTTTH